MKGINIYLTAWIVLWATFLPAQESKLANQYFQTGEYEKAAVLYKKLYEQNNQNDYYFNRYLESILTLERYLEAESLVIQEMKRRPNESQLYIHYGNIFEKKGENEKAEEQYRKAIKKISADVGTISRMGNLFLTLAKYDLAIEVYESGSKKLNDNQIFSYNLADLYRRKGDTPKMIEHYLESLIAAPNRLGSLQSLFQRYLSKDEFSILQTKLYQFTQKYPDDIVFAEMLQWVFINNKDYARALRQARAIDMRMDENGSRVYELANIAQRDGFYDDAIKGYEHIIESKGPNSPYYINSKLELLGCKRKKITESYDFTPNDLRTLESEFESFIGEFGKNSRTVFIIIEYAKLKALYLDQIDQAIDILEEIKNYAGIRPDVIASVKIDLGDYYLIKDDVWEASLLYSQVDKDFKEGVLGERARYRNAMLSYYNGDFEWAQKQFDILKAATSKLISNDAIDMSVFIIDNLGLDTTDQPLRMYAQAELLLYQNKYTEAFTILNSIIDTYPNHGLTDDILYLKARIHAKRKNYEEAIALYSKVVEDHKEEIRADNALMEMAELYHFQLNQPEKAKELYEMLFMEFSNSIFAVEARKRFRQLRGDEL